MTEWPLYRPVIASFRDRGFHVASQVADPKGSRVEFDVVAFTPEMDDVRVVEVKAEASDALIAQCRDRWRYAARVYAATAKDAESLLDADAAIGVLAVDRDRVTVLREAKPVETELETGKVNLLHRLLGSELAER